MPFIEIKEGGLFIDDSDTSEKYIIDSFMSLAENNGFDYLRISSGVEPSPDFGYFALADRFWRASLCIYFSGVTHCFWERGIGFSEPWLFNARHSIELYIKGFLLNTVWLDNIQSNPLSPVRQTYFNFREIFNRRGVHHLSDLYKKYQERIESVIATWNTREFPETLELSSLLLSNEAQEILKELDEADNSSFRFRYPSLKQEQDNLEHIQKAGWNHDNEKLFPKTGLPKESSYFFDHIKVINGLHQLIHEMKSVHEIFDGFNSFRDEQLNYYLSQFNNETFY
jgi:hypothetical protein